jgi:bacterioferritin
MGKKALEIAGPDINKTIKTLRKAYAFELATFHFNQYVATNIEGLGTLHSDFFETNAKDELGHAKQVNERLMQLGTNPSDDPATWEQESGTGKLEPKKYLSLKSAIVKSLEFERQAVDLYNDLANATKDTDNATYDLALSLLKDELKDEQALEDILARLEISEAKTVKDVIA